MTILDKFAEKIMIRRPSHTPAERAKCPPGMVKRFGRCVRRAAADASDLRDTMLAGMVAEDGLTSAELNTNPVQLTAKQGDLSVADLEATGGKDCRKQGVGSGESAPQDT